MALPHVAPAWLFVNGPEELLVAEPTFPIRNQAELVGSVAEDEGDEGTEAIGSYLISLGHQELLRQNSFSPSHHRGKTFEGQFHFPDYDDKKFCSPDGTRFGRVDKTRINSTP